MKLHRSLLISLMLGISAGAASAGTVADVPYRSCFELAGRMHQIPVDLLVAVAAVESAMNPDARSNRNAHGLMQIQWPGTAKHLGVERVSELYNPCLNIELGARYLRELLDQNQGDVERALAAYNYGPGRIARSPELPSGARGYASKVAAHRQKISRRETSQQESLQRSLSVKGQVHFDSKTRAQRFAASLNNRIRGASFASHPARKGGYRVSMLVSETGLSSTDLRLLESLGWNDLGGG